MANSNEPVLEVTNNQEAEAKNIQRMADIQKCLDTSGLEKIPDSPITLEYRNLDFTKHRLVYDGPLAMKIGGDTNNGYKTTKLHVFLFEKFILLLQKQKNINKYLLRFYNNTSFTSNAKKRGPEISSSPVIKLPIKFVRPVISRKRDFYLLKYDAECTSNSEIYIFVAPSTHERTQWIHHIRQANKTAHNQEPNSDATTMIVSDGKKVLFLGSAVLLMCVFISAVTSTLATFL